jgi:hypothetical protein
MPALVDLSRGSPHVVKLRALPVNGTDKTPSRQPETSRFPRVFISALIVFGLLAALILVGWLMLHVP